MGELLEKISESCAKYYGKKLDDAGFRKIIEEIPTDVWQEKDSALAIVKELVENEALYEVSLEQHCTFEEFICRLLPKSFFENPDYVLGTAELILDFEENFSDDGPSCCTARTVFSFIPQALWENDDFATAAANIVIDRAYSMYDLNCISDVIPESVWKNEENLIWVVRRLYNEDERNMNQLSLFPEKSWESANVMFEILDCLQCALENDREWGTMYCNFRGDNEDYLRDFLDYVPDAFKSDKDFILGLLDYDCFSSAFGVLCEWMDEKFWSDKEFVLKFLERDEETPVQKMAKELLSDPDFMGALNEIFDVYGLGREFLENGDDRGIPCLVYAAKAGSKEAEALLAEIRRKDDEGKK